MNKVSKFIKDKHIIIIVMLLIITLMQTCSKRTLKNKVYKQTTIVDSIKSVAIQKSSVDSAYNKGYLDAFSYINTEMSKLDRPKIMMDFQKEIIISKLENRNAK